MLDNKSILITGGTGSFGKKFIEMIIQKYPAIKKVVVYSRNELKQYEMTHHSVIGKHPSIKYVIGDVRDKDRLLEVVSKDIDFIIHAAALKHTNIAEQNPMECIKTNILGAYNIIEVAKMRGIQKVVALSTDKATAPNSLYGATKLCADKLFISANNWDKDTPSTFFSVVRYGNVMGSSGSVIPFFLKKRKEGILPITHPQMTRFSILAEEAVQLVLDTLENSLGGEIFIPKLPSFRIVDLVKAVSPQSKVQIIGIRPGEKLHEEMITEVDALNTIENKNWYILLPDILDEDQKTIYCKKYKAKPVKEGFSYTSDQNTNWLSQEGLQKMIQKYIDKTFKPF